MNKISKELEHMMKVGLRAGRILEKHRKRFTKRREETIKILKAFKNETQKEEITGQKDCSWETIHKTY